MNNKKYIEEISQFLSELIKTGTLRNRDFSKLPMNDDLYDLESRTLSHHTRKKVVRTCSWWLTTRAWIEWAKKVTEGKKVLEICAGHGWLRNLIPNWTATDITPKTPLVNKFNATEAIEKIKHDILFLAWAPYQSEIDYEAAKTGKPLILIGEGEGGCTGSEKLWEEFSPVPATDKYDFEDVPNWFGLQDRTWLVNWK